MTVEGDFISHPQYCPNLHTVSLYTLYTIATIHVLIYMQHHTTTKQYTSVCTFKKTQSSQLFISSIIFFHTDKLFVTTCFGQTSIIPPVQPPESLPEPVAPSAPVVSEATTRYSEI